MFSGIDLGTVEDKLISLNTRMFINQKTIGHYFVQLGARRVPRGYEIKLIDHTLPIRILIEGQAGFGKSVLSRVIEEVFKVDYEINGLPHPIFFFDYKGNYLGFDRRNDNVEHLVTLLERMGFDLTKSAMRIITKPFDMNIYTPAYAVPDERMDGKLMKELEEEYHITDLWKINWRNILDLNWIAQLFKIETNRNWVAQIQNVFDKIIADESITLEEVIGEGGILEHEINRLTNAQSKKSALAFLEQWRKRKYLFDDKDPFAAHVHDDFSYNVLTFNPVYSQQYANQVCFILAVQSIVAELQKVKKPSQPLFVFSDANVCAGKGAPLSKEVTRAILQIFNGFGRSGNVGFALIVETQNIMELSEHLRPTTSTRYTHIFKMEPIIRDFRNNEIKIIKGRCYVTDMFLGIKDLEIVVRPPFTKYYG